MNHPILRRLTAWLCLALVLLTGMAPAQGFVVCIEEDGCVSIEVKAPDATCGGCEGHDEGGSPRPTAGTPGPDSACPCVDIALAQSTEEQLARIRAADVPALPWIAPPPEVRALLSAPEAHAERGPPADVPRAADSLAHHCTVVILV